MNEREKRLAALWDRFVEVSQQLLDGKWPEEKGEPPSAAHMKEMRMFLERNEVNVAWISREDQTGGPRGKLRSLDEGMPFPREGAG